MSFFFFEHPEVPEGSHALISPSRHILKPNYTIAQFENYISANYATRIGTSIHELAAQLISAQIKVTKSEAYKMITLKLLNDKVPRKVFDATNYVDTFVPYVKDAIGFEMEAEKILKYSRYAFGTTDAIRFNESKNYLRIHDLKTGKTPASLDQLVAYAALFFLEYKIKPGDVTTEIRIYQNGEIISGFPTASDILPIMDQIVTLNKFFEENYGEG
jgi:hypothetical protein